MAEIASFRHSEFWDSVCLNLVHQIASVFASFTKGVKRSMAPCRSCEDKDLNGLFFGPLTRRVFKYFHSQRRLYGCF